jgi:hypothetical protein
LELQKKTIVANSPFAIIFGYGYGASKEDY